MHYKNGRESKIGDKILVPNGNYTYVGVVVDQVAGAETCNLYVTPLAGTQLTSAQQCLHLDDVAAAFADHHD